MTLLNKYPLITSIPIAYYNKTGSVDFDVLVFTKNSSLSTPVDYHVAWQVLRGETSVHFNYPLKMQVGARFYNKGQKILCGPHDTNPGTTWEIIHKRPDATPELIRVTGIARNNDGAVVIKNTIPDVWNGRKYDVGLFRDNQLLLVHNQLHVGNQVDFLVHPILFFAIGRNFNIGEVFTTLEFTSYSTGFDLNNYPNGMAVTLTQEAGGGKFAFTASNKTSY